MQQLLNGLYYIHSNKVQPFSLLMWQRSKCKLQSDSRQLLDFASRYEGRQCVDYQKRYSKIGRFRLGPRVQSQQEWPAKSVGDAQSQITPNRIPFWLSVISLQIHKSCGDTVVPSTRTAAWRSQLWTASWYVGCWLHYGRNVDTIAHYAGQHRTTANYFHITIVWFIHARRKRLLIVVPMSFLTSLRLTSSRYGLAFKVWNCTPKWSCHSDTNAKWKIDWKPTCKTPMAVIC